jgi:hypothetical protein
MTIDDEPISDERDVGHHAGKIGSNSGSTTLPETPGRNANHDATMPVR